MRVFHSFCDVFSYRQVLVIESLTILPIIFLALGISPSLMAFLMWRAICFSLHTLNPLFVIFGSAIPVERTQVKVIECRIKLVTAEHIIINENVNSPKKSWSITLAGVASIPRSTETGGDIAGS